MPSKDYRDYLGGRDPRVTRLIVWATDARRRGREWAERHARRLAVVDRVFFGVLLAIVWIVAVSGGHPEAYPVAGAWTARLVGYEWWWKSRSKRVPQAR